MDGAKVSYVNPRDRWIEKAASRQDDQLRLALGHADRDEIARENGFFSGMKILRMDVPRLRLALKG